MGTSALRAMAMGRVVIVSGEKGYSELVSPKTIEPFFRQGFYGIGAGLDVPRLASLIGRALDLGPESAGALGIFGRELVCERFSLDGAAVWLEDYYTSVLSAGRRIQRPLADSAATTARLLQHLVQLHNPRNSRRNRALARGDHPRTAIT